MRKSTKVVIVMFVISLIAFTGILLYTNIHGEILPYFSHDDNLPDDKDKNDGFFPNNKNNNQNKKNTVKRYGITNQQYVNDLVSSEATNIMLIGKDQVAGIYDSMTIASVDEKNKTIKLIMFPRDIYVDYSDDLVSKVQAVDSDYWRPANHGIYRINNVHNIGVKIKYEGDKFDKWSINFLADYIEEVYRIKIHDYIMVSTKGFVEIVDLFGGVELEVPYRMYYEDPYQNLYINLKKGKQHLNGKNAEGFVRFRQGTDSNGKFFNVGDVERKQNQITFLKAFFEQNATPANINKANDLFNTINKNIETSIDAAGYTKYVKMLSKAVTMTYPLESYTIEGEVKTINKDSYYVITTK